MATQAQFENLLRDIEPSPTTVAKASAGHMALRAYLRQHTDFKRHHINTYLSGSYKRDTSIRPRIREGVEARPDVDIIVVTNHTLFDPPAGVVDLLFWTLRKEYPPLRRQARSVGVTTPDVDMDVVPIIAPYGEGGTLYIPDRQQEKWVQTNPPRHTAWTTEQNKASDGRFKPLVKLMKWWRRENPTVSKRPKGFVVECFVAESYDPKQANYAELFLGTLEGIVSKYQWNIALKTVPFVSDPGVPGNSVTAGMSFDAFEGFYNKAKAHAALGREALAESDDDKALAKWRAIFGQRFPANGRSKALSLLSEAVVPGALSFPNRPVVPQKPGGFA